MVKVTPDDGITIFITYNKFNDNNDNVEKGTFTPIVGSTFGGWGAEATGGGTTKCPWSTKCHFSV